MILNHLMLMLQSWSFKECSVTLLLPLLPGPLTPGGVVVAVRVPSMGQVELFNHLTVYQ